MSLILFTFAVSAPAGFPDHPHRGFASLQSNLIFIYFDLIPKIDFTWFLDSGFETVTYMLQGCFTHQDFAGHKGTIRAGDLQVRISNTQKSQ